MCMHMKIIDSSPQICFELHCYATNFPPTLPLDDASVFVSTGCPIQNFNKYGCVCVCVCVFEIYSRGDFSLPQKKIPKLYIYKKLLS